MTLSFCSYIYCIYIRTFIDTELANSCEYRIHHITHALNMRLHTELCIALSQRNDNMTPLTKHEKTEEVLINYDHMFYSEQYPRAYTKEREACVECKWNRDYCNCWDITSFRLHSLSLEVYYSLISAREWESNLFQDYFKHLLSSSFSATEHNSTTCFGIPTHTLPVSVIQGLHSKL